MEFIRAASVSERSRNYMDHQTLADARGSDLEQADLFPVFFSCNRF